MVLGLVMGRTENTEVVPGICLGDTVAGKYVVDRVLGSGGMGVVVQATHVELRESVAIKLMLPEVSHAPELGMRFLREARAAARLKSHHVARVNDIGTLPDGTRYMVMEFLHGADLAQLVAQRGPLPLSVAVSYVIQACDALAEAHELNIVHRDLKPANLFAEVSTDGSMRVKVLDFGISKADEGSTKAGVMTQPQAMMGSPLYASPEQLLSAASVDVRTDIWSLGVVLYELLTGVCPFDGPTIQEVVAKVVAGQPAPLSSFRTDITPAFEQTVMKCLQKDREARFSSVRELVGALLASVELDQESLVLAQRIVRRDSGVPHQRVSAPDLLPGQVAPTGSRSTGSGAGIALTPTGTPIALRQQSGTGTHAISAPERLSPLSPAETNTSLATSHVPVRKRGLRPMVVALLVVGGLVGTVVVVVALAWPLASVSQTGGVPLGSATAEAASGTEGLASGQPHSPSLRGAPESSSEPASSAAASAATTAASAEAPELAPAVRPTAVQPPTARPLATHPPIAPPPATRPTTKPPPPNNTNPWGGRL